MFTLATQKLTSFAPSETEVTTNLYRCHGSLAMFTNSSIVNRHEVYTRASQQKPRGPDWMRTLGEKSFDSCILGLDLTQWHNVAAVEHAAIRTCCLSKEASWTSFGLCLDFSSSSSAVKRSASLFSAAASRPSRSLRSSTSLSRLPLYEHYWRLPHMIDLSIRHLVHKASTLFSCLCDFSLQQRELPGGFLLQGSELLVQLCEVQT